MDSELKPLAQNKLIWSCVEPWTEDTLIKQQAQELGWTMAVFHEYALHNKFNVEVKI